ncbi:hypothetical protein PWT90_03043 [Aphanocladium album]|nr:hypothetical protein PWT90_03043 [Aphanocladium album]
MLRGLLRPANWLRRSWKPLVFANQNFTRIPAAHKIEEETLPGYVAARYYPTRIGEIFQDQYQVVGKLGYGATSTVWLARDLHKASRHNGRAARLPQPIAAFILQRVFLALDYLHTECQVIHTDIKADNIMFEIPNDAILVDSEEKELQDPCPRKETEGRCIYTSQELTKPKNIGAPVLCDFGSAVVGGVEHLEDVQPNIYRAPEVIMEVPWTYSIDIWNVGCMIWDIFEGNSLFTGQDPEFNTYRSRAHLAEMISLLGPPPPELVARGQLRHKFFDADGKFTSQSILPDEISLADRETILDGEEKAEFLRFVSKMLQWEPEKRSSAKELAYDDWICRHVKW